METKELLKDPKYLTPDMIIPIPIIERAINKKINGVIHVGANYGEESNWYRFHEVKNVIWIEPLNHGFKQLELLRDKYGDQIYNCAISDEDGNVPIYEVDNIVSSSLRPVGRHNEMCPLTVVSNHFVEAKKLSTLIVQEGINIHNYNMLVIDTQGTEDLVLKGAKEYLNYFDVLYIETNEKDVYIGTPPKHEINEFLSKLGFKELISIRVNPLQYETVYTKA